MRCDRNEVKKSIAPKERILVEYDGLSETVSLRNINR